MKYYNGDQKNGKTLRDIQNIKINRKLPNIYNIAMIWKKSPWCGKSLWFGKSVKYT